jgi:hypothetical protein
MASLVGVVSKVTKSYFDVNKISVDNWTFKCFYKASTTVFVFSSVLVTARQFFGAPITCDAGSVSFNKKQFLF